MWGTPQIMRPSRFLQEIPADYLRPFHAQASPRRELEVSEEFTEEETGFAPGESVLHRDFGVGIVERAFHTSHGLTYDVFFPQANTKRTLVAKYARLIRSDSATQND
jgi:DNA helicase-2/ATP-dependent DNA helicase PcrA